jgi:hypothetical protein
MSVYANGALVFCGTCVPLARESLKESLSIPRHLGSCDIYTYSHLGGGSNPITNLIIISRHMGAKLTNDSRRKLLKKMEKLNDSGK